MIIGFWSAKGGSGVSVFAAACAIVASRRSRVTLVDCAGDQPRLFGVADPELGVRDWLAIDTGSAESLARIAVEATPGITLLGAGTDTLSADTLSADIRSADADAGARLATALRAHDGLVIIDLGRAEGPVLHGLGRALDVLVLVMRPCYLAFNRALGHPLTAISRGVVLNDEARPLGARDLRPILGLPLLASFEPCPAAARAIDGGTLPFRVHESLARPASALIEQVELGHRAA